MLLGIRLIWHFGDVSDDKDIMASIKTYQIFYCQMVSDRSWLGWNQLPNVDPLPLPMCAEGPILLNFFLLLSLL